MNAYCLPWLLNSLQAICFLTRIAILGCSSAVTAIPLIKKLRLREIRQHSPGLPSRLGNAVVCNCKAYTFNNHRTLSPKRQAQTPPKSLREKRLRIQNSHVLASTRAFTHFCSLSQMTSSSLLAVQCSWLRCPPVSWYLAAAALALAYRREHTFKKECILCSQVFMWLL